MSAARFLTTLLVRDDRLRAAFQAAPPPAGASGAALVAEAAGGLAGLAEDVARAVDDFAARGEARAIVFVSCVGGVGGDALQGLTRGYAAALAPRLRVNAICPARADEPLDARQAAAALDYLLGAGAVTGQTVFIGPG